MPAEPVTTRLAELPGGEGTPEQRAAKLLRSLPAPEPLSGAALARIEAGIEARLAPRAHRAPRWLQVAVAACLVIAGPFALAAVMRWRSPPPPPASLHDSIQGSPAPVSPPSPPAVEVVPPPVVASPPDAAPVHAGSPPPSEEVGSRSRARPSPAGESPLAAETRLLGLALRQLRQEGDARGALATLDEHRRRFPRGQLLGEERVARLEALLALEERGEALGVLEALGPAGIDALPRAVELHVLRAELLGEAGRCAEALPAFERSEAGARGALLERVVYGRATCLARLGDAAGSRAELRRYLELFPAGRFSAAARSLLGP